MRWSIAAALVRLSPPAFRARWGKEVLATADGSHTGDLLRSLLPLWLHPAVWPATSGAQRRHRAAGLAVVVTAGAWYLLHAATELDDPLNHWRLGSGMATTAAVLIGVGLLLVAPRPVLTIRAGRTVLAAAARALAVPGVLGAAVVICANGVGNPPLRPVLFAIWWLALALGAVGVCRVVLSLDVTVATPPSGRRLRLGVLVLAGTVAALGAGLLAFSGRPDVPAGLVGAGLLVAAALFLPTLRDLREVATD